MNKFKRGDIVELVGWSLADGKEKIPVFGIVYGVPHDGYEYYNVYIKDLNEDHYNDDMVIMRERELK